MGFLLWLPCWFGARCPDAFEQHGSRLVSAPFAAGKLGFSWHEFAAKGFGKDGLLQLVHLRFGFLVAGFKLISKFEEGFDAADDFLLFSIWR